MKHGYKGKLFSLRRTFPRVAECWLRLKKSSSTARGKLLSQLWRPRVDACPARTGPPKDSESPRKHWTPRLRALESTNASRRPLAPKRSLSTRLWNSPTACNKLSRLPRFVLVFPPVCPHLHSRTLRNPEVSGFCHRPSLFYSTNPSGISI